MMFDQGGKLNDVYPWCADGRSLRGQEVSITYSDTLSPASFALDSLLVRLVKDQQQRNISVLSLSRPKRHYEAVFRKNGMDLEALKKAGKLDLYVLDMSTSSSSSSSSSLYKGSEDGTIVDVNIVDSCDDVTSNSNGCWEAIVAWVNSKSFNTDENATLLVDDLDTLNFVAISSSSSSSSSGSGSAHSIGQNAGVCFLYNLRSIFNMNPNFLLVTMGCEGVVGGAGCVSVTEYMKESSTLSISINPLASGYSSDCHGIIRIDYGLRVQLYKYKALDSGIKCVEILNTI